MIIAPQIKSTVTNLVRSVTVSMPCGAVRYRQSVLHRTRTNGLANRINNDGVDLHIERAVAASDLFAVLPDALTDELAVIPDALDSNPWLFLRCLALLFQRLKPLRESR